MRSRWTCSACSASEPGPSTVEKRAQAAGANGVAEILRHFRIGEHDLFLVGELEAAHVERIGAAMLAQGRAADPVAAAAFVGAHIFESRAAARRASWRPAPRLRGSIARPLPPSCSATSPAARSRLCSGPAAARSPAARHPERRILPARSASRAGGSRNLAQSQHRNPTAPPALRLLSPAAKRRPLGAARFAAEWRSAARRAHSHGRPSRVSVPDPAFAAPQRSGWSQGAPR